MPAEDDLLTPPSRTLVPRHSMKMHNMSPPRVSLQPYPQLGIHRLPDEVLMMIFSIHVILTQPYVDVLSHVCFRWRSILLNMPSFWVAALRFKCYDYPYGRSCFAVLDAYLSRTAARPLDFIMHCNPSRHNWDLLYPHLGRLTRLCIHVRFEEVRRLHRRIAASMNSLEQLSLDVSYVYTLMGRADFSKLVPWTDSDLPRLHTLSVYPGELFAACAVTSLRTVKFSPVSEAEVPAFIQALGRCPSLEVLSFEPKFAIIPAHMGSSVPGPPPDVGTTRVVLPHLRKLVIDFDSSMPWLIFLLRHFVISRPLLFALTRVFEEPSANWRSSFPELYPIARIDTITIEGRTMWSKIRIDGHSNGTLCFREYISKYSSLRPFLEDVKSFLYGLPPSVHTLCIHVPHFAKKSAAWRELVNAVPGLRTLSVSAATMSSAKRTAVEAFLGRAASFAVDEAVSNLARFELVWVFEDDEVVRPTDLGVRSWEREFVHDVSASKAEVPPPSVAMVEEDLALLGEMLAACPHRDKWSLTLTLKAKETTELLSGVWRRRMLDLPHSRDWKDIAMDIPAIMKLAEAVDEMYLLLGDTKLHLG